MKAIWKAAAAAAAILLMPATDVLAQPAGRGVQQPVRLGGKPNMNGIWQAMSGANWNLEPHDATIAPVAAEKIGAIGAIPAGLGVVEGGVIPYKPDAVPQRDANRRTAPMTDPEAACYLPGIPRATYMDHAFQIVQAEKGPILFVYEYASANRAVEMKAPEPPPIDTWMGTSYAQWEGDTLKITTLGQNGRTWMDRSGNYLTPTATVTERFRLVDKDHMDYEATIEDPALYTRPWKISMPLYRHVEKNAQLLEFKCVPFAELLLYGDLLENGGQTLGGHPPQGPGVPPPSPTGQAPK